MKIDMTKLKKKADIDAAAEEETRLAALEASTLADALRRIDALEANVAKLMKRKT